MTYVLLEPVEALEGAAGLRCGVWPLAPGAWTKPDRWPLDGPAEVIVEALSCLYVVVAVQWRVSDQSTGN